MKPAETLKHVPALSTTLQSQNGADSTFTISGSRGLDVLELIQNTVKLIDQFLHPGLLKFLSLLQKVGSQQSPAQRKGASSVQADSNTQEKGQLSSAGWQHHLPHHLVGPGQPESSGDRGRLVN